MPIEKVVTFTENTESAGSQRYLTNTRNEKDGKPYPLTDIDDGMTNKELTTSEGVFKQSAKSQKKNPFLKVNKVGAAAAREEVNTSSSMVDLHDVSRSITPSMISAQGQP